ncbi:hypothetical protein SERLA73DRAFT_73821 [Serpula lacrymans var. lacrymans S7.3]|uniref:Ribosomal RNA methyltransferase FtsJ domain-containing protein n=2 Tax=Serpula lacrymans var. lacrymans TaxID=341189 RepID=F8PWW1_SERL3|nr:uncharacterized protein SERLADRAFT_438454 [Serpula lacrymans var. lacrymans S7.9]EGN99288.1 hypothetical protein SERLA73DRAFT_73821 [Serpula lacrymans var. lacrymans S7.3]EGO24854.1 hypothetical protein SERLADRAFT_438454 [Serpula lacrymans var. lacrymans S7.9]
MNTHFQLPSRLQCERSDYDTRDGEEGELKFVLESHIRERGVREFIDLMKLKRIGWRSTTLDGHFQRQRNVADNAGPSQNYAWFIKMKNILGEIDHASDFIPNIEHEFMFLDLGCCPGGFTSYILDSNRKAAGLGISLEVEQGGHMSLLSEKDLERFSITYTDLTYFQLAATRIEDVRLSDIPVCIQERQFDIVLLDAHHLRMQLNGKHWDYCRLQIAQLIIALMAIRDNGTIVMKLSNPHRDSTAQLLYMLDVLSLNLILCKPQSMHANRGTFYAIAKGFGLGSQHERLDVFLKGLQELWVQITFGGEERTGRYMEHGDLDFIVTMECLAENYVDRLVELCRDVWAVQANVLWKMFIKKGIPV